MASKEAPKKEEVATSVPAKSGKKMILLIMVGVLVFAVVGLGTVLILKKKGKASTEEESVAEETSTAKFDPHKPPVFLPMEPFTVNLQPENGEQFLQVVISLRVVDEKIGEQIKVFMPQIRHEILSLLSSKKSSEITSQEGRESLAEEMRGIINSILGWTPPKKKKKASSGNDIDGAPVAGVFFTQFIVQ